MPIGTERKCDTNLIIGIHYGAYSDAQYRGRWGRTYALPFPFLRTAGERAGGFNELGGFTKGLRPVASMKPHDTWGDVGFDGELAPQSIGSS